MIFLQNIIVQIVIIILNEIGKRQARWHRKTDRGSVDLSIEVPLWKVGKGLIGFEWEGEMRRQIICDGSGNPFGWSRPIISIGNKKRARERALSGSCESRPETIGFVLTRGKDNPGRNLKRLEEAFVTTCIVDGRVDRITRFEVPIQRRDIELRTFQLAGIQSLKSCVVDGRVEFVRIK